MKTSPTLSDVARIAGVSTATVSRCLSSPDKVVDKTRQRVMKIIDELGYTPHFGGRALALRQSNTVGAVVPTMDNAIFAAGLQAFQEELASAGTTLLVGCSRYDSEQELSQIKALVARGIDGLMLIGEDRPASTYSFIEKRNIPFVITWNYRSEHSKCYVGFDNYEAAQNITELVLKYGHQHVAMISGMTKGNDRASDRVRAVRDSLDSAGLLSSGFNLIEAEYSLNSGAESLSRLWGVYPRPTAVICGNDVLAAGAVNRALEMGLKVPEDISITGYDDIELATVVRPKLTTVHVPHRRMGKTAAQKLLELKDSNSTVASKKLTAEIVVRETLGKPIS